MKVFFTGTAAAVLSLAMIGTSQAAGHVSYSSFGHSSFGHQGYHNYHLTYGRKFEHGYYYPGRHHNHWSYSYWDKRYGCYLYYDRCCSSYYYYSAPASCYYPVSYCPSRTYSYNPRQFPPTTVPAAIAPAPLVKVNVTNTATAVNNSPGVASIPDSPAGPMPGPAEVSPAPDGDR